VLLSGMIQLTLVGLMLRYCGPLRTGLAGADAGGDKQTGLDGKDWVQRRLGGLGLARLQGEGNSTAVRSLLPLLGC
jgi:hypothetical protein